MKNNAQPLTPASSVTFGNLTVIPLVGTSVSHPAYDTLDGALAAGTLRVTETSESGSVPEIRVRNDGRRPVLIIDGEELVGAKQNRTVNLSIMVAEGTDVTVPVTCVEAGRWHARSRTFASAQRTHFAAGRAAKSTQVTASLLNTATARADQRHVWDQIEQRGEQLQAPSATRAMSDIFDSQTERIEQFVHALPVAEGQVGAVFVLDGQAAGVDLFDHPAGCRALYPKILRGYALDALAADNQRSAPAPRVRPHALESRAAEFLKSALDAPRRQFALPGLGDTWRLLAPGLSGGGVTLNGSLVHLSAFRA